MVADFRQRGRRPSEDRGRVTKRLRLALPQEAWDKINAEANRRRWPWNENRVIEALLVQVLASKWATSDRNWPIEDRSYLDD